MARRPNLRHLATVAVWLALFASAPAQQPNASDPLAESLGLTRATGSLPLWQKPDAQSVADLSEQVRAVNPSVFIIGSPNNQYGTGFVISKKHRLVATNAHVADLLHDVDQLLAIGNETTDVFKVEKVWYHPGVIRETKAGINVRSQNPNDGEVFPMGPDVAVLQLAGDQTLPEALPLADPAELDDLFGKPVGMIGFPGHDTIHWPQLGEMAAASYHQGVVARLTDFVNSAAADSRDRQFLRHTMGSYGGFSGSPIFLANGKVAAIHNAAGSQKSGPVIALLAYGIRIDCLWELLAYHDLHERIALPLRPDELRLARFEGNDPRLEELQAAKDLVQRANILRMEGKLAEAGQLYNEAIRRAPNFAEAHRQQGRNYNRYLFAGWDGGFASIAKSRGQISQYVQYSRYALESDERALQLDPTNIEYVITVIISRQNLAYAQDTASDGVRRNQPASRAILDNLLATKQLTPEQLADAYIAYAGSFDMVKDQLPWETKAIEADPFDPMFYTKRASNYDLVGQHALAAADRRMEAQVKEAQLAFTKAWRLATSPDDSVRNGEEAVRLAERACDVTKHLYWKYLGGLAAAHAEAGDFDAAVRCAESALELAPEDKQSEYAIRLRNYRNHKPWRE